MLGDIQNRLFCRCGENNLVIHGKNFLNTIYVLSLTLIFVLFLFLFLFCFFLFFGALLRPIFIYHHDCMQIMMFQRSLMGQRSNGCDRYREWRLDVDNMTYEELLELGDKIGYVNTGLREDEIVHCLRKSKLSNSDDLSTHIPAVMEWKCSICQEEYGDDDEMGKLECGHNYHIECIKQWLVQKNSCPVCKAVAAASQN